MPDDLNDDLDDDPNEPPGRAHQRRIERENRDLKNQIAEMQRTTSFTAAGVDVASPLGSMFAKAYDGDPSPLAVKAAWEQIAPPAAPVSPGELDEHARAAALSGDGQTITPNPLLPKFADPAFTSDYHSALNAAKSQAEVLAVMAQYGSPAQTVYEG